MLMGIFKGRYRAKYKGGVEWKVHKTMIKVCLQWDGPCSAVSEIGAVFINTLRPRQNGRHFTYDIFKCISLNENVWIPIKISLKFVPKGPICIIPGLDQIMAWRWPGDKPLSEPMMVSLPKHICFTRPQWVNCGMMMPCRIVNLYHHWLRYWFRLSYWLT